MKTTHTLLVLLLSLGLIGLYAGCPETEPDDDSAGDDDTGDDDSGDDDSADDDDTPPYEGTIDMDNALLEASCMVTDESTVDSPEGAGYFEFFIDMSGWAAIEPPCWIEMWDQTSEYCEGFDPKTGEPCALGGDRPGWDMVNVEAGWNEVDGFWDTWELTLDYHGGEGVWPPDPDASLFICETAGDNFEVWFCCCDLYDDTICPCTMFPMEAW